MLENLMLNDFKFKDYSSLNHNLIYLDYINVTYEFKVVNITPDIGYKYQGNFYGLLKETRIVETDLYLYTLYLNKLNTPYEYDGELLSIKIPIRPPIPKS